MRYIRKNQILSTLKSNKIVDMYQGQATKTIPRLVAADQVILSCRDIMEERVNFWNSDLWKKKVENKKLFKEDYQERMKWIGTKRWIEKNEFSTGDAFLINSKGKIKIATNCEKLEDINKKTRFLNGYYLRLEDDTFDKTQGQEFTEEEVESFITKETLENPIWQTLVQGDLSLLKEYTEILKAQYKCCNNSLMPIIYSPRRARRETIGVCDLEIPRYGSGIYLNTPINKRSIFLGKPRKLERQLNE